MSIYTAIKAFFGFLPTSAGVNNLRWEGAISYIYSAGGVLSKLTGLFTGYRLTGEGRAIITGIILSLVSTGVLVGILFVLKILFDKLYPFIRSLRGTVIRPLKFQKWEIVSATKAVVITIKTARVLRVVITAALLYAYATLLLSFFNVTRGFGAILFNYLKLPVITAYKAFVTFAPNLLYIAIFILIAYYVVKLVKLVFTAIANEKISIPGFYAEWAVPTYQIVRFVIIVFTLIIIFPYLPGSDSPAFRGVSIFLGVLFSLGSTSAIANIVAGLVITYMRPFKLGDRVKIADTVGDVIEKNLLVTRIRTIKNVEITVPNAMVLTNHVINFSAAEHKDGLILHTSVTLGYDIPWRTIHELLIKAAESTENILEKPSPFVLQTALDDFTVNYELNAYTDKPGLMANTYSDLHRNIQDRFNEAGVEIMSPRYFALRDGTGTAIPDEYLPKNFNPPAENPLNIFKKPPDDKGE
jgi:small-conductance mechanosensitive channel